MNKTGHWNNYTKPFQFKAAFPALLVFAALVMKAFTAEIHISPGRTTGPARCTSRDLAVKPDARELSVSVSSPESGYLAFMVVLTYASVGGDYKLSTPVQVTPDNKFTATVNGKIHTDTVIFTLPAGKQDKIDTVLELKLNGPAADEFTGGKPIAVETSRCSPENHLNSNL